MSRINTNIASLRAMTRLNNTNNVMQTHLQRLSSGLRINSGKDDPAGLIASENLRSEMAGISQAIGNSTRASSVIATAEGALNEVGALLLDIKGLINASANEGGLAPEEIKANQLQIDSAISSINRIANTTAFEGVKLLNGQMDFTLSGVNTAQIHDLRVDEVRFGTASSVAATITVDTVAEKGQLRYLGGTATTDVSLEISGVDGQEVFNFKSGATRDEIAAAINQSTDVTGIRAISSGDVNGATSGIVFETVGYGSKRFVSVETRSGTFAVEDMAATAAKRDLGADASVSVNGVTAVTDGLDIQINGPTMNFEATLDATLNVAASTSTFTVTGGGAQFQLGPAVNAQQQAIIGLENIAAHRLGTSTNGYLSQVTTGGAKSIIDANYQTADKIVSDAIKQVANLRGRLGAFQKNVLETNINSLNVALENVTASESAIRDADFAKETAALTRAQILTQAGTNVLAIANSAPQNVLALLG